MTSFFLPLFPEVDFFLLLLLPHPSFFTLSVIWIPPTVDGRNPWRKRVFFHYLSKCYLTPSSIYFYPSLSSKRFSIDCVRLVPLSAVSPGTLGPFFTPQVWWTSVQGSDSRRFRHTILFFPTLSKSFSQSLYVYIHTSAIFFSTTHIHIFNSRPLLFLFISSRRHSLSSSHLMSLWVDLISISQLFFPRLDILNKTLDFFLSHSPQRSVRDSRNGIMSRNYIKGGIRCCAAGLSRTGDVCVSVSVGCLLLHTRRDTLDCGLT